MNVSVCVLIITSTYIGNVSGCFYSEGSSRKGNVFFSNGGGDAVVAQSTRIKLKSVLAFACHGTTPERQRSVPKIELSVPGRK